MTNANTATGDPSPQVVTGSLGLQVKGIGKSFHHRTVVHSVSLSLQRGEIVGLLGPNGAGKTVCFYMITGLLPVDYGTIELDGYNITNFPMYRRAQLGIGYLPQESSLFRGLTVQENILASAEHAEPDNASRGALVDKLLQEFSISHIRHRPSGALSGGERRRVEIARSLAMRPSYILLDEPLAGIDPLTINTIRDLVRHLKDRGIGVLITDHNVHETLDLIDRGYIIHNGEMIMEGTPIDIAQDQNVRRVYLGTRFSL